MIAPPVQRAQETYLGDAVYASFDGEHVWLRTSRVNGDHVVALDAGVFTALLRYVVGKFGHIKVDLSDRAGEL